MNCILFLATFYLFLSPSVSGAKLKSNVVELSAANWHPKALWVKGEQKYQLVDIDFSGQRLFVVARMPKDLHIALTQGTNVYDAKQWYEIVFGSDNNTRSTIRLKYGNQEVDHRTENTPNILADNTQRPFWVTWNDKKIRIGRGNVVGIDQLSEFSTHTIPITHVFVSGYAQASGSVVISSDPIV